MKKGILLVIVATLLSAQAQDVVESGQHTQWGSLRYRVPPGQYTVMGELIQGDGVVGVPRVDNPSPQVVAEQVQRSVVEYTPSYTPPPPPPPGEVPNEGLILYDPLTGEPLAWFRDEAEARQYLSDRYFNELKSQDRLRPGQTGGLPHYYHCTSEGCQEVSWTAEGFKREDQNIAERALRIFLETVREVAQAIADFVQNVVQQVADFFARVFDWVQNAVDGIMANIGGGSDGGSGGGSSGGNGSGDNGSGSGSGSGSGDNGSGSGSGSGSGDNGSGSGSGSQDPPPSDDPPPPPGEGLTE